MKFTQFFGASVMAVLIAHSWASAVGPLQPDYIEGVAEERDILASCKNNGMKLTTTVGKCSPSSSKGFLSAHNCDNKGGKYYYCVTAAGAQGTCTAIRNAKGLENGECFL